MIYLLEREIGFDAAQVGFPSVAACRAIVAVTPVGLCGYHLNGALNDGKQTAFVNFVLARTPVGGLLNLYAASESAPSNYDRSELSSIASDLGYTGKIYWATLPAAGSNYVEFLNVNNTTCGITARAWVRGAAHDEAPANKGPFVAGPNRVFANGAPTAQVYTNVATAGLKSVYPTAL